MDNNDYYSSEWSDKGRVELIEPEKKLSSTLVEKAGWIMAVVIMLVVIAVMTVDIKSVTFDRLDEISITFVVLIFCSYSMYGNMYHTGMTSGKKLDSYKKIMAKYSSIRAEIKTKDVNKKLAEFCKQYVDNDYRSRCEEILDRADVTWEEYSNEYKYCSKKDLNRKLPESKIRAIIAANKISPIVLTPQMIYWSGEKFERRNPLALSPSDRRFADMAWTLSKTCATSLGMCFVAFEAFANPSWEVFCAVAIKLLTVALNGYAGFRRGYDNIAVDTVNYTEDQIDMLEQFKKWKAEEVQIVPFTPTNPLIADTTND